MIRLPRLALGCFLFAYSCKTISYELPMSVTKTGYATFTYYRISISPSQHCPEYVYTANSQEFKRCVGRDFDMSPEEGDKCFMVYDSLAPNNARIYVERRLFLPTEDTQMTKGSITGLSYYEKVKLTQFSYRYYVNDKRYERGWVVYDSMGFKSYQKGDMVDVIYSPGNPKRSVVELMMDAEKP